MREIVRTEGVVLRRRDFGETSRVAVVFTLRKGKVQLLAKGARRTKSKFGASLEPLTYGEFVFYYRENKDLYTLSEASIIRSYDRLRAEPASLVYGLVCAEATERLTEELDPDAASLRQLAAALDAVERGTAPRLVTSYYLLRLAANIGFGPALLTCKKCGRRRPEGPVTFSPADGAVFCKRCTPELAEKVELTPGAYRLLAFLTEVEPSKIGRIKTDVATVNQVMSFVLAHLRFHTGLELKALSSLRFIGKPEMVKPR